MAQTRELIEIMQQYSAQQIAQLMKLSANLADLNYQRYQDFDDMMVNYPELASAYVFQGDVYQGLDFASLDEDAISFSQEHLGILSGLYGLLKPLDTIVPYRLEMGTKLNNAHGNNLYDFWRSHIAEAINRQLAEQDNQLIVNLASQEYFGAVAKKLLNYPVVDIDFKENKNGQFKTIGIHAKKARGAMARFILLNKIDNYNGLLNFDALDYRLNEELSTENHLIFSR